MTWPVYVPSKGRARSGATTIRELAAGGVAATIVVEPQDADAYGEGLCGSDAQRLGSTVAVLPENDQGLAYVRNWIIAHARAATGGGWIWMLDDDITRFFRVEGARCVPAPAGAVLRAAEAQIAARPGATLGALEYQQYAWRATGKPALNGYCDVAVCVHTGRFRGHFRADMDLKLDRDIVLQVLTTGGHTVRVTDHAFAAPKNGSNKGGLYDDYAQDGREAEASRRLAAAWPGLVTAIVKPDGRPDAKINWRAFSARAAAKRDRDLVARR